MLPDRSDFKTFGDDVGGRVRAWQRAITQSQQLADEFATLLRRLEIDALHLA